MKINFSRRAPKRAKQLSTATTTLCFWFFRCRVDVLQSQFSRSTIGFAEFSVSAQCIFLLVRSFIDQIKMSNKTLTLFECQCNEQEITKVLELGPPIYVVIRATRRSGHCKAKALPPFLISSIGPVPVGPRNRTRDLPLCSRVLLRLNYSAAADLATERELRYLTTGKGLSSTSGAQFAAQPLVKPKRL